ncbi:Ig-like domain-containing protein [Variovorax sp. GT1P44]|uniref:Ig-like domain-containing protein n=1 Tax=Variovorax sp. GT1P44 TaxID=3443742 RepID=UPI003F45D5F6
MRNLVLNYKQFFRESMSKKASIIVSDGVKNVARVVDANSAVKIKAKSGVKYLLKGEHDDEGPENVTVRRVGDDLHVSLEGESSPAVVLESYYALPDAPGLYGVAEDGQLYAYVRTDGGGAIFSLADGAMEPVALGGDSFGSGAPYLALSESNDGFGVFWPLMLMGGLAGLGFAAVNSNRGSSSFVPTEEKRPVLPPQKPGSDALSAVMDDVGSITGPIASGGVTDDANPEFIGIGTPGNTITIYDNGKPIGSVLVPDDGNWNFTPLNDGGLADGSIVKLYDGTTLLGSVQADASGNWSFTPGADLKDGAHNITATATDATGDHAFTTVVTDPAGNASAPSEPLNVTVDTQDVVVSIGSLVDDQGAATGNIAPNGMTDDARPEIQGTGKAGSTITVYDGATALGTTEVKPDGSWSFTPDADLSEGEHSITATATDKAGQVSDATAPFNFSVDTQKPEAPSIGAATDDVGALQGALADGDTTDDPTPTFAGIRRTRRWSPCKRHRTPFMSLRCQAVRARIGWRMMAAPFTT